MRKIWILVILVVLGLGWQWWRNEPEISPNFYDDWLTGAVVNGYDLVAYFQDRTHFTHYKKRGF